MDVISTLYNAICVLEREIERAGEFLTDNPQYDNRTRTINKYSQLTVAYCEAVRLFNELRQKEESPFEM